jgi:predicted metal-dependent enzyme (double-stranded beta helix superfamily)
MNESMCFAQIRKRRVLLATSALLLGLFILHFTVYGQDKSDFPDGYDAVQAAPKSHRVIFENAFVRVLEVTVSPGTTVPMHHHRWPSLLLSWDTGGKTPHIHYRRQDGSVRDIPRTNEATHPGLIPFIGDGIRFRVLALSAGVSRHKKITIVPSEL